LGDKLKKLGDKSIKLVDKRSKVLDKSENCFVKLSMRTEILYFLICSDKSMKHSDKIWNCSDKSRNCSDKTRNYSDKSLIRALSLPLRYRSTFVAENLSLPLRFAPLSRQKN